MSTYLRNYCLRRLPDGQRRSKLEARAADPPVIPVGPRRLQDVGRWPYQRIGAAPTCEAPTTGRVATTPPTRSHFLYQEADDFNVSL